jgi:murein L,D-transpeptidase YafK
LKTKLFLIALVIVALFGLTGAKVVALWPQQGMPSPAKVTGEVPSSGHLVGGQDALLARLDKRLQKNPADYEASLLRGLVLFQSGELDAAVSQLRALVARAPKFQLAHLILGDLLRARFDQVDAFGTHALLGPVDDEQQRRIEQLQSEARARIQGYMSLVEGVELPQALTSLDSDLGYALVVDKSKNRLYVYRNGGPGLPPELVDDFYIVLGRKEGNKEYEGDLKTPNGVYFVTSYLPDEKLPPLYGSGAFPVNYPNAYDRRLHKTGSGIWLHGTEKSLYSRPPRDSEGCVVLTNEEFQRIIPYVQSGKTPVIITEAISWISSSQWLQQNIEIQAALETWRKSWEDGDISAYLANYSADFWSGQYDNQSWGRYKERVFAGKSYQQVGLADLSVLSYPATQQYPQMKVASFTQDYRSNNFNGQMRKQLYLVKQDGRWKILYEGKR